MLELLLSHELRLNFRLHSFNECKSVSFKSLLNDSLLNKLIILGLLAFCVQIKQSWSLDNALRNFLENSPLLVLLCLFRELLLHFVIYQLQNKSRILQLLVLLLFTPYMTVSFFFYNFLTWHVRNSLAKVFPLAVKEFIFSCRLITGMFEVPSHAHMFGFNLLQQSSFLITFLKVSLDTI